MTCPLGLNLSDNTPALPLGLLASPVNHFFGPVVEYNILTTLCFFTAATSTYFLINRWVSWRPAAFVGAFVFGFSPYMVGEAYGRDRVNLIFVALVRLLALLLDDILIRRTRNPLLARRPPRTAGCSAVPGVQRNPGSGWASWQPLVLTTLDQRSVAGHLKTSIAS